MQSKDAYDPECSNAEVAGSNSSRSTDLPEPLFVVLSCVRKVLRLDDLFSKKSYQMNTGRSGRCSRNALHLYSGSAGYQSQTGDRLS